MDPTENRSARQRDLIAWFDTHARDLPWRRDRTLYGTWIAEIMLQQTTVATVIPRWLDFLRRFPDVRSLAAASEADVMTAWSGLGYYRRARSLHRAARQLVAAHGGALPHDLDGWRALPGVGVYAAGAIASMGLGLRTAAVDANVRRVLTRWTCADPEAAARLTDARLQVLAAELVCAARPGDWNEALMDLGAGPCRAGAPVCEVCPVRAHCVAGRAGTAAVVPPPRERVRSEPVVLGCLALRRDDRVLLVPGPRSVVAPVRGLGRARRRDLTGLFDGLLGLPLTPWYAGPGDDSGPLLAAWRRWLGGRRPVAACGWVRHAITVYRLQVLVASATWPDYPPPPLPEGAVWECLPATDRPLSSLARKALQRALAPHNVQ